MNAVHRRHQAVASAPFAGAELKGPSRRPCPQSPCRGGGAPSSSPSASAADESRAAEAADAGVGDLDRGFASLAMTTAASPSNSKAATTAPGEPEDPAKENVRPNHQRHRNKWRKKLDRDHRRAAAEEGAAGLAGADPAGPTAEESPEGPSVPERTKGGNKHKGDENGNGNGTKLRWKAKKAVVVEISSGSPTPILPPRESPCADEAEGEGGGADGSPSSASGGGGGRNKKSHRKNAKQHRRTGHGKSRTKRGPRASPGTNGGADDFDYSTNAGGATVLALLGQHPPYYYPGCEGSYDGSAASPSAGSRDGTAYHHHGHDYHRAGPYDPAFGGYYPGHQVAPAPYPYHHPPYAAAPEDPATATPEAAAAPLGGYYVPATNPHDGAVYYVPTSEQQHFAYYCYPGYAPSYGTEHLPPPPLPHAGRVLNVDAPAFSPKEGNSAGFDPEEGRGGDE